MRPIESFEPAMWADQPRSKTLVTVATAQDSYGDMLALFENGAAGSRLNMSHMGYKGLREPSNYASAQRYIDWTRRAQNELGVHLAVVLDLQGPKNRFGSIGDPRVVEKDEVIKLRFGERDDMPEGVLPTQINLIGAVDRDSEIRFCDGTIPGTVVAVEGLDIFVQLLGGGTLESNKSINTPGSPIADILPTKDRRDLHWGAQTGEIDWVAQSFGQTEADAILLERQMRQERMDAFKILKAETASAVDDANLYKLIRHYQEIWVARGDLGAELPFWMVPEIQKKIIGACHAAGISVRVCTQLMPSLTDGSLVPTRAEGTDVYNAASSRAGIMFSEETGRGENPPHVLWVADRLLRAAEQNLEPIHRHLQAYEGHATKVGAVALGISEMAERLDSPIIVAQTLTGRTAMEIAALTDRPVVAVTSRVRTAQQLALIRGVIPVVRRSRVDAGTAFVRQQRRRGHLDRSSPVVVASGLKADQQGGTSKIDIV